MQAQVGQLLVNLCTRLKLIFKTLSLSIVSNFCAPFPVSPLHCVDKGFTKPLLRWIHQSPIKSSPQGLETPLWDFLHKVQSESDLNKYLFVARNNLRL